MTRIKLLATIGLIGVAAAALQQVRARMVDAPRLSWVATAHQFGPVGYRDPPGAVSPDGKWIAYSEGRFLRVQATGGGAGIDFPPGNFQIRTIAWSADSARVAADGFTTPASWGIYMLASRRSEPLTLSTPDRSFRQLAWSRDGDRIAAVANGPTGNELHIIRAAGDEGTPIAARIAFPAWTPKGEVACIATVNGRSRVTIPCGGPPLPAHPQADAYGPIAFSPDGSAVFVSLANARGTVDLWSVPTGRGESRQLTSFSSDAYAPSISSDGAVVFKVQSYRTHVAVVPAAGGASRALATFQSETPSWDPSGKWLGITYGTWRRQPDDANYPDIAQDAGIIPADSATPAVAPSSVVHDSVSEDQSLCWSPNGQWIAFHSHKDLSDDIWLRRATGDPAARRITSFGRGAESGWPRWSRDGRWLMFTSASRETRRPAIYVMGLDQTNGTITEPPRELALAGLTVDVYHAEWTDAGSSLVAIGKEGPGQHVIFTVSRDGGAAQIVHRFTSEHDTPGLGASPDGQHVAFIAPAADGFFQVFRMPIAGGPPSQVTTDPSHKTQPSWSPDGQQIAFTVWSYDAQFWRLGPEPAASGGGRR